MALLNLRKFLFGALQLAGMALFTGQVWATIFIPITNFSFESPTSTTGTLAAPGTSCSTTAIPGWTCSNPTIEGVYATTATQYAAGQPDGSRQAAFMLGAQNGIDQTLTQTTAKNFVPGTTYTLTVWAGWRNDDSGQFSNNVLIQLLNGATVVAKSGTAMAGSPGQVFIDPAKGTWVKETLTYVAQPGVTGLISVGLLGNTNGNKVQINWDDVVLTPEPSILLLLAAGFGSLVFARRKKKNLA